MSPELACASAGPVTPSTVIAPAPFAEVQRAGLGEVDGAEAGLERDGAERAF